MTKLAELSQLSPQAISAYESGLRDPTMDSLKRLSSSLNVPVRYFLSGRPISEVATGPSFFRSVLSARTRREQEQLAQLALWTAEVVHWLGVGLELPKVSLPVWKTTDFYTEEEIEEASLVVRKAWKLGNAPIPHLVRLLESKGIYVVRQYPIKKGIDAFSKTINGRPFIFLSSEKGSPVRSRFDAAHELGHLVLHSHLTQEELADKEILKRVENEANYFASAFLLPEDGFASDIYSFTINGFIGIKRKWRTSIQAMILRAADLGILLEEEKKRLLVQVSARGYRRREPLDDKIEMEEPIMGAKAWTVLKSHTSDAGSRLLTALNLPVDFISLVLSIERSEILPDEINSIITIDFKNPKTLEIAKSSGNPF